MIEVAIDAGGFEIKIPYHDWLIFIDVKDEDGGKSDICICNKNGIDITEEFLQFHSDTFEIKPTGINLYQVMDLLKTNLKRKEY